MASEEDWYGIDVRSYEPSFVKSLHVEAKLRRHDDETSS